MDLSGQSGTSIDLKAYNSTLSQQIAGGDFFPNGPFANFLARKDFNILHVNIGAQTASPITTIPTTLRTVTPLSISNANITRNLTISDTMIAGVQGVGFVINHKLFAYNYNNYQVPLNNTEIWQIASTSNFGHPFHIHDVEFNILSINGAAPPATQAGWKDVIFVPANQTVRFIAKFDDYADKLHPFMYHCHIALHEDDGMMGQFIVTPTTATHDLNAAKMDYTLYPNPVTQRLYVKFADPSAAVYYVKIVNSIGRTMYMLPRPELEKGIDIAHFASGIYFMQLTDDKTKQVTTQKFVKN